MWVAGDGIMFGLMMLVFFMWSRDERAANRGHGWLESARRASLAGLVAGQHGPGAAAAGGAEAGSAGDSAGAAAGGAEGAAAGPAAVSWDARGGIDDDEHLAAYNAFLARLNEAETGRKQ
jgi:hypothetical protein